MTALKTFLTVRKEVQTSAEVGKTNTTLRSTLRMTKRQRTWTQRLWEMLVEQITLKWVSSEK